MKGQLVGGDDWDSHWRTYDASHAVNPAQWFRYSLILDLLASSPLAAGRGEGKTVVDIGCGPGDLLLEISRRWPDAVVRGVDVGEYALELAGDRVPSADFAHVDLTRRLSVDKWPELADVGVITEVLEHVDDPVGALRNAAALLAPGATLVVTVPAGPLSAFDRHIGHRHHFTRAHLGDVLVGAGFDILSVEAAGFPFFNLYRLMTVAMGSRLIDRAEGIRDRPNRIVRGVGSAFDRLMRLSTSGGGLGWQLLAVARLRGSRDVGRPEVQ